MVRSINPEGVLLGGFGTVQDITDRKQMEEALRESEEKFRSAFDKGAVPMAITGLDSRIVLANSAFSRMLGYSESELAGVSIYGFTHPDDIQVNAAGLAPVMTGGQDSFRMEKRYIRKDGRVVWVDMSTASARGSNGKPLYIVTHAQDITDRKEAEEKLRRSESLYRRMALRLEQVREEERAALARELHDEMGQLLAGLRMDLSWLRKRLPEENKELIEKADAMQEYLLPLIKKVRRLYTELRPSLLDEVGLIAAIEAHLHDFHQRTGIIAKLETNLRQTSLGSDQKTALFRIVQEALTNVLNHSEAGRVVVNILQQNGQLHMRIADDGKGILYSDLEKPASFGILGIRERIKRLGGEFDITGNKGRGTVLKVSVPVQMHC